MRAIHHRLALTLLAVATLSSLGCGNDVTAPVTPPPVEVGQVKPATIELSITTTGVQLDPDGYAVYLNRQGYPADRITVPANGTLTITPLEPGNLDVQLGGVSGNCVTDGGAIQNVTLGNGATIKIAFAVRCVEAGALEVAITTTGGWPDPDGYSVSLAFEAGGYAWSAYTQPNGTYIDPTMLPGNYTLTLNRVSPNCDPAVPSPQTITVSAGSPTAVRIDVTCVVPAKLAFVNGLGSEADIYVVNSDGSDVTRLTSTLGADVNPAWSPDGSRIAFASDRDGNRDIYVMDSNGGNVARLTSNAGGDYLPTWSPDGAHIAFVSERSGSAGIYVMNVDGTNLVRLTAGSAGDSDPAWSPDGSRIAFRSGGTENIYVMNADGSGVTQLTYNSHSGQPKWSPDGKKIVFVRYADIYTMNADGSDNKPLLAEWNAGRSAPSWSPDGRKIAFALEGCSVWDYYDGPSCPPTIEIVSTSGVPYSLTLTDAFEPAWRP